MMKPFEKTYVGDGLYMRYDGYHIWLTSENGIEVLDRVALDSSTLRNFLAILKSKGATI